MSETLLLGRYGEALAAEHLRKKGFAVLGMNYRTRFGEIDVIAENNSFVVFAEVKLRKSDSFAEAREFVTPAKQKKLLLAAQEWLTCRACEKQPRFDVVEIYAPQGIETKRPVLRHWENAFGAGDG